ncbi:Xaa-Pro peptidase family protein [Patescibacteria group bacterium]|nr:Xaa-Pro peptidase family protein [Patescibacteria group bacterium]
MKNLQRKIESGSGHLIMNPSNIAYLSNFTGTKGAILITKNKSFFFTDARYAREAKRIVPKNFEIIITGDMATELEKLIKKLRVTTINFESQHVSYFKYETLKKALPKTKLKPCPDFAEQLRMIKTKREIAFITGSQRINEKVLREVIENLRYGKTEKQIAWEIEKIGHDMGADELSFPPIVGFGSNSGCPHHMSGNRKLKKGDMVLIDMGMKYKGYCSDMTRIYFTKKPTQKQALIYNLVLKAQETAIATLKAGILGTAADNAARDVIEKAGYGPQFSHSLGHGVGLEIHEAPSLSVTYDKPIPENTVVTVEPGIYLEKSFGVRIEDMVLIKRNKAENLTKTPKQIDSLILSIS